MMNGIVDTTVLIHVFRSYKPALKWLDSQHQYGITSITWLELMEGASSKQNQNRCKILLSQFQVLYVNTSDQQWAMSQLEIFQFSHHIGYADCLIASIANRLQLPLYTHNLKHMKPLIGNLAVQPYVLDI